MIVSTAKRTSSLPAQRLMAVLAPSALVSTILLVAMGSIVRVTGNGLGCPDWPLCYGRVIPPALTGAWVEFTHRLLGGLVSLQIVLLSLWAWRYCRNQPWMFRSAMATLGLLVVQVGLGGLHVIFEIPPVTGLIHTGVAMLIVGLVAVQVTQTLPAFQPLRVGAHRDAPVRVGARHAVPLREPPLLVTWISATVVATYVLLLTGSYVTRSGASLACPAFPGCGSDAPAMHRLINIQMLHRYVAFTVAFLTLVTIIWLLTRQKDRYLSRIAYSLSVLLLVQLGLGIANVLLRLPMWSRVLHLAVAASFWAGVVVLWNICLARQTMPGSREEDRRLRIEN